MRTSQHVTLVIIKWLLTGAALAVALPAGGLALRGNILTISLLTAIALYVAGDLILLPRLGSTAAAVADGVLAAFIVTWLVTAQTGMRLRPAGFFAVVLSVGVLEWLLHPSLLRLMQRPTGMARIDNAGGLTRVGNTPIPVDPINDPTLPIIPNDNNQIQFEGEQPARTGAASRDEMEPPEPREDLMPPE